MSRFLVIIFFFAAYSAHAFGSQFASLRTQATQGAWWSGTATINKESFDITVHPDYLDVVLEWEIGAGGSQPPGYANALEIVGNLNLEQGSVVTGLFLWNGNRILKAKLKTRADARADYEQVVDRSAQEPPRPRDPVVMEWLRDDNYNIAVFPVSFGATRKLRLRYIVPAVLDPAGYHMRYPNAFSPNAQVTIRFSPDVKGCALATSDGGKASLGPDPVTLSPQQYSFQAYGSYYGKVPLSITPVLRGYAGGSIMYQADVSVPHLTGQALHMVYSVPKTFQELLGHGGRRLFASMGNGSDTCNKEINLAYGADDLRIYSTAPLDARIIWRLFSGDTLIKQAMETPAVYKMDDPMQFARMVAASPFYPIARTLPSSLAAVLGFVDPKYSLVALEDDVVDGYTENLYAQSGVPPLAGADIFPGADERYDVPLAEWLKLRNQDRTVVLRPGANSQNQVIGVRGPARLPDGVHWTVLNGALVITLDAGFGDAKISLHDLRGSLVKEWTRAEISGGRLAWSPADHGLAAGIYLLKVRVGGSAYALPVAIR